MVSEFIDEDPPFHFRAEAMKMLRLSWPAILTFLAFSLRRMADVWMVSQLGAEPLAAITAGLYVLYVPEVFGLGLLISVNTYVSQYFGKRDYEECGNYAWQGIYTAVLLGCAMMILSPASGWFFQLFGHEAAVYEAEVAWFEVAVLFLLPWYVVSALNNFYFGLSRPKLPMYGAILAFVANLAFNYVFIFGLGPIPAFGIVGAAWGSVLGATVQAVFMLCCFFFDRHHVRLNTRRPSVPSKPRIRNLLKVGIPNGLHEAAEGLVWGLAIVWLMGAYGTYHLAAAGVIVMIIDSLYAPSEGFGGAVTAMVGRDIGRRDYVGANRHTITSLGIVAGYMLGSALLIYVFRAPFLGLFCHDPETFSIANQCIIWLPLMMAALAVINVYDFGFNASGDNTWPAVAHIAANVVFILIGGIIVSRTFPHIGSFGMWTLIAIDLVFVAFCFRFRWFVGRWKRRRLT